MDLAKLGYFPKETIDFPSEERLRKKPVAIAECVQKIPCNPCADACPVKAITINNNINNSPVIDFDKCTGCGLCLGVCPGLSIFLLHIKDDSALITIPYELFPPEEGECVELLDRQGNVTGKGTVHKVRLLKQHDRTLLVTLKTDINLINEARGFRRLA